MHICSADGDRIYGQDDGPKNGAAHQSEARADARVAEDGRQQFGSALRLSLVISGSPLFCILRSAVNSLPTRHPIATIPKRQHASVWTRFRDSERIAPKEEAMVRSGLPE